MRLMDGRAHRVNSVSGKIMLFLSFLAFITVVTGYGQPPQPDEGTGAHIFQLSIVLLAPVILIFLATADWSRPRSSALPLALTAVFVVLAFGALYYLEHYWYANYGLHGDARTTWEASLLSSVRLPFPGPIDRSVGESPLQSLHELRVALSQIVVGFVPLFARLPACLGKTYELCIAFWHEFKLRSRALAAHIRELLGTECGERHFLNAYEADDCSATV
jgi:hypothetical protein